VFAHTNTSRVAPQSLLKVPHHGKRRAFDGGDTPSGFRGNNLKAARISLPPGSRLRSIADFFYAPKTMERIVDPILSDLQLEYFNALAENRKAKADWVRVRAAWALFKALGLYAGAKHIAEIWKIARGK
jgi:hypothetical protein